MTQMLSKGKAKCYNKLALEYLELVKHDWAQCQTALGTPAPGFATPLLYQKSKGLSFSYIGFPIKTRGPVYPYV